MLRPSGDVFQNVCNVVVNLDAEKSDNGSMSSPDTARTQKLSEMLIKRDIWKPLSSKPCLE